MQRVILIRYSEIGLKGANRADFERALSRNIARNAGIAQSRVKRIGGRLYIETTQEEEASIRKNLRFVFGVHAFSCGWKTARDMEAIMEAVLAVLSAAPGGSFKIDAHRADKTFALTSPELNQKLGERALNAFPDKTVAMHNPSAVVHAEVRQEGAFVYGSNEQEDGPGGLPVGTGGRALLLLSGGIDSPVAGWHVMKRGVAVDALYFYSPPFTGEKSKEKVVDLSRELSRWRGEAMNVYVPVFAEIQKEITNRAPEKYWTLLFRRSMHRIAEIIAGRDGYAALITGDALAQVASQTLENIAAVDAASNMPVLRPLIGFDKDDTIALARRIGTYELSIQPYEDCCTVFTPKSPKTRSSHEKLSGIEKELGLSALERTAADNAEHISAKL